jgi:DNA-binding NtrC family response regulator
MSKRKVLIIDDEAEFIDDLALFLGDRYELIKASSSKQGWELFRTEAPDVILLDINMPAYFSGDKSSEGLELLKKIKGISETPVFIVSGQDSENNTSSSIRLGALQFFTKPFDIDSLIQRIDRALESA